MSLTIEIDGTHDGAAVSLDGGRAVVLACPACGEERNGTLTPGEGGRQKRGVVECDHCGYRTDPGVLEIPTSAVLAEWRSQAIRHARTSIRCADASVSASYLAVVWCRRLSPELTAWGKSSLLDEVLRPVGTGLTDAQRWVVLDLGIALGLSADAINRALGLDDPTAAP